MKKNIFIIFYSVLCLTLCSYKVFADDDCPNPVDSEYIQNPLVQNYNSDANGDDNEADNEMYEYYGSNQSPTFNNTENIAPNEANYDYQGAGGNGG